MNIVGRLIEDAVLKDASVRRLVEPFYQVRFQSEDPTDRVFLNKLELAKSKELMFYREMHGLPHFVFSEVVDHIKVCSDMGMSTEYKNIYKLNKSIVRDANVPKLLEEYRFAVRMPML